MKEYFSKDNFVFADMDAKQKKQSIILSVAMIVMFLVTALTFVNFLFSFADIVGSIVSGSPDVAIIDLLRMLPLWLCFLMPLWTLLLLHGMFRNVTDERREKSMKKNAIVLLSMGGLDIVYVLIGRIAGKYLSLVEGSPSALYPLDTILFSLLFVAIGVLTLLYLKKWKEKAPYVVPSRGPIVTKARGIYNVGITLWLLIALFSCAEFILGWFIIDFAHGYVGFSLALLFEYLVVALSFVVWEFYYNELKVEQKKERLFGLALAGLILSVLAAALYFIALGTDLDAPSNVGFGVLPIAFTASVNIATLVVVITPIIASVIALIKGIKYKKQAK